MLAVRRRCDLPDLECQNGTWKRLGILIRRSEKGLPGYSRWCRVLFDNVLVPSRV
jgi:hypothetical protein